MDPDRFERLIWVAIGVALVNTIMSAVRLIVHLWGAS